MSLAHPKAPATFVAAQKKRALESNQAMMKALREHRFEDALEHARTALALEPNNVMVKDFIRLLEEKQALGETDDDSETEGAGPGQSRTAASDEDSEDEDEEGDTDEAAEDEDDSEESEESEEEDPAVLKALERLRLAEPRDPQEPRPQQITATKRYAMRASLSASIKELLLAELAKEMAADEPLLRT